jgi:hypothetical protein
MKSKYYLIMLLILSTARAQIGNVNGTVLDEATQQPLPGVNVKLYF